jgi:soluble lytic murein transglycosylase-like protein
MKVLRLLILGLALAAISSTACAASALDKRAEAEYYADAYADYYNVPRELVRAIIAQESNWRPDAVSSKGAMGIMQLMPETAARFGVKNSFSIDDNIRGGVRYLAELIHKFGDFRLVVAGYYAGSHQLEKQGLSYSNSAVHSYVVSVRQLYHNEIARHSGYTSSTYIAGEVQ